MNVMGRAKRSSRSSWVLKFYSYGLREETTIRKPHYLKLKTTLPVDEAK
jgi:hypothetical protein